MKYGMDLDLEDMADQLLQASRPVAPKRRDRKTEALQRPLPLPKQTSFTLRPDDRRSLEQLISWAKNHRAHKLDMTWDIAFSYCPATDNWLVWCSGYDGESRSLSQAISQLLSKYR